MENLIYGIDEFNAMADHKWHTYCLKCQGNNLKPQPRNNFNQFMKFDYKTGFVVNGNYPLYYKTKKAALKTLGLI